MWSNELGELPIKMPSMLSLGQPRKDSLGASRFFFFPFLFFPHEPVCEPVINSQGHSLLLAPACQLSFLHLPHTFSHLLCPLILSPEATIQWVHVTPPHLLTFYLSCCFLSACQNLRLCILYIGAHSQLVHAHKTSSSFSSLSQFNLHIFDPFSYLYSMSVRICWGCLFIISSLLNEPYSESVWVTWWPKLGIQVYSSIRNGTNYLNSFFLLPFVLNIRKTVCHLHIWFVIIN